MSDDRFEDAPGSTIEAQPGSTPRLARIRELERALQLARAELVRLRRSADQPRKEIYKERRWAECKCGHVDVYPCKVTLRGKGSANKDPGRLRNQRCRGCAKLLGVGAHRRALERTLEQRRAMRKLQKELSRQTRQLAASFQAPSSRRTAETPAQPSAAAVARGASSAEHAFQAYRSARVRELGLNRGRKR